MIEETVFDCSTDGATARNLIAGSTPQAQFIKLAEELGEVAGCIAKGLPVEELAKELGDMLVIAAQHNLTTMGCACEAYAKIKHRKGRMQDGVFIKEGD